MKDRQLTITRFVADSKRPIWMIELMCYIRNWFPFKYFHEMATEDLLHWIENAIKEVTFWSNGEIHKVTECAFHIIEGNKLTVFSVRTGKPMIEYEIEECKIEEVKNENKTKV